MNIGGWIILIIMWGGIIGVSAYCFARVLMDKTEPGNDENE
jgi:hypothetical protein